MKHLAILGGIGLAVATLVPNTAAAQSAGRHHVSHGTAACQSALPVGDANLRKRPMAIANEGTRSAFVTCDTASIDPDSPGFDAVGLMFVNRAAVAGATVSCTLVDGMVTGSTYLPRTSARMKVGESATVLWARTDKGGQTFVAPAVSCSVPAGMDLVLTDFVAAPEPKVVSF